MDVCFRVMEHGPRHAAEDEDLLKDMSQSVPLTHLSPSFRERCSSALQVF